MAASHGPVHKARLACQAYSHTPIPSRNEHVAPFVESLAARKINGGPTFLRILRKAFSGQLKHAAAEVNADPVTNRT